MEQKKCWSTYFLISLGIHGLALAMLALTGFQFPQAGPAHSGQMEIQLVGANELERDESGDGAAGEKTDDESLENQDLAAQEEELMAETREESYRDAPVGGQSGQAVSTLTKSAHAAKTVGRSLTKGAAATGAGGKTGISGGTSAGSGDEFSNSGRFSANGDGSYTALSTEGIAYTILKDAAVAYPEEARSIGYSRIVTVQAKILVGLDGDVDNVEILNSVPDLGFKETAIKALRKMKFAPIYYKNHNIKMYFTKNIHFQP